MSLDVMPDLDAMSREALIDYACGLQAKLDAHRQVDADASLARVARVLNVPPMVARYLCQMSDGRMYSKDALLALLHTSPHGDQPSMKIVDVMIHKTRRAIAPYGLTIETRWGVGHGFPAKTCAAIRQIVSGGDAPPVLPKEQWASHDPFSVAEKRRQKRPKHVLTSREWAVLWVSDRERKPFSPAAFERFCPHKVPCSTAMDFAHAAGLIVCDRSRVSRGSASRWMGQLTDAGRAALPDIRRRHAGWVADQEARTKND